MASVVMLVESHTKAIEEGTLPVWESVAHSLTRTNPTQGAERAPSPRPMVPSPPPEAPPMKKGRAPSIKVTDRDGVEKTVAAQYCQFCGMVQRSSNNARHESTCKKNPTPQPTSAKAARASPERRSISPVRYSPPPPPPPRSSDHRGASAGGKGAAPKALTPWLPSPPAWTPDHGSASRLAGFQMPSQQPLDSADTEGVRPVNLGNTRATSQQLQTIPLTTPILQDFVKYRAVFRHLSSAQANQDAAKVGKLIALMAGEEGMSLEHAAANVPALMGIRSAYNAALIKLKDSGFQSVANYTAAAKAFVDFISATAPADDLREVEHTAKYMATVNTQQQRVSNAATRGRNTIEQLESEGRWMDLVELTSLILGDGLQQFHDTVEKIKLRAILRAQDTADATMFCIALTNTTITATRGGELTKLLCRPVCVALKNEEVLITNTDFKTQATYGYKAFFLTDTAKVGTLSVYFFFFGFLFYFTPTVKIRRLSRQEVWGLYASVVRPYILARANVATSEYFFVSQTGITLKYHVSSIFFFIAFIIFLLFLVVIIFTRFRSAPNRSYLQTLRAKTDG